MVGETPEASSLRGRYLALLALRWFPTGLLLPVLVLLLRDRGLGLTQIGVVLAAQGVVVLLLELPTGGLADTIGRRTTLLAASVVDVVSLVVLASVAGMAAAVGAFALQGIYRALESGPLDAWFVDATLAAGGDETTFDRGLALGGTVLSVAIATGSLLAGVVAAVAPRFDLDPLVLPITLSIVLRVVNLVAIVVLMKEPRRTTDQGSFRRELGRVPVVVAEAVRVVRRSRVLVALVGVEFFWAFGMTTFESLFPVRLAEVAGDPERAAAILGPAVTAAWVGAALAAAAVPALTRRFGNQHVAAAMRLVQGATVVGMGVLAGVPGVLAAYFASYAVHGAANPVHQGLLHRQVGAEHRTTVLSVNSMVAHPAGAIGGVVLGAVADGAGLTTAMVVGGIVLALAAPLYLVGRAPAPAT